MNLWSLMLSQWPELAQKFIFTFLMTFPALSVVFCTQVLSPGHMALYIPKIILSKKKEAKPELQKFQSEAGKIHFYKAFFIKYYIFLNICKHQKPLLSSIKIEAFNHSKHTRSSQSFPKTSSSQSGAWQISLSAGFSCSAHIPSRLHTT